ncbi:MAG: hypothetical protein JNK48_34785, partial [Bryobacterales bacterium]|nr:hypothetical protein [Bryobacterales bacterium]
MRIFRAVSIVLLCSGVLGAQPGDRKLAEWTLLMGGRVRVTGSTAYLTDIAQLPEGGIALEAVDWVGVNVDPPDLERFTGLRQLKQLHLPGPLWNRNADGGRDGSRDLKYLASVESLETLTFSYHFLDSIRFKDTGLAEIKSLANLRELVLSQSAVKGHTLAPFVKLRHFDCTLCPIDDDGMRQMSGMREMRRLRIGDTAITDAAMAVLRNMPLLEELDLHGTAVTDAALPYLAGLRGLKKLNLMGTAITDAGAAALSQLTA